MTGSYIPGTFPPSIEPLGRFMPPIPDGSASDWLIARVPVGSWVLDPFGTSPRLVLEIARLGYRVLVTANNPIIRFIIEMAANPPLKRELETSLAILAAAYRGDDRVEPHLRSIYHTECAHCGSTIMADSFLWEHAEGGKSPAAAPYARIYTCDVCRDSGERPCNQADITRSAQFSTNSFYHARALERVIPRNDPDRPYAEQAINVYLPRVVYALFTLINKLDGLDISPERRQHLAALLLHACDQANVMWKYPSERERRYQLVIPPHFREQNVWLALEAGLDLWSSEGNPGKSAPVSISSWSTLQGDSQNGLASGIWIYEGRLKSLAETLAGLDIKAVCSALPRPNQAFWSLSALWAGWLWGQEAIGPFRGVLRRQRYDWYWHTSALFDSFTHLGNKLSPTTPFFGLLGEFEPNYLAAVLVAADMAGFDLQNLAIRPEIDQAQITWQWGPRQLTSFNAGIDSLAKQEATRYLEDRSEPASFAHGFTAALVGAVNAHAFNIHRQKPDLEIESRRSRSDPSVEYSKAVTTCKEVLSYRNGFLRFSTGVKSRSDLVQLSGDERELSAKKEQAPDTDFLPEELVESINQKDKPSTEISETGMLWLRDTNRVVNPPLADRIELSLVNYLIDHERSTLAEIDQYLCNQYPGLFTPDIEYIQTCLDSYGQQAPTDPGFFRLRSQDLPSSRQQDLDEAYGLIERLGDRIGYHTDQYQNKVTGGYRGNLKALCWKDRFNTPLYCFYPISSAIIGEVIVNNQVPAGKGIIVLPGGRANLVVYKLRHDPRLARLCDRDQGGWKFLKYRHLRWLMSNPLVNIENIDEQFLLDPLTFSTPQLRLL